MSSFGLLLLANAVIGWELQNSQYFLRNGSMASGKTQFAVSTFACAVLCERSECAAFHFMDNRCHLADDYGSNSNASVGIFYAAKSVEPETESFVLEEYCPFDNTKTLKFTTTNCPTLICQPKLDKLKPKDKRELCDCLNDCLESNCQVFARTNSITCLLDSNYAELSNIKGRKSDNVQNCTCVT